MGSRSAVRREDEAVVAAFQPIFDLRDGCVVGYEALARPRRRLVARASCSPRARAEGRLARGRPRVPRGGAARRRGGRAGRAVRALPQRRRGRARARPAGPPARRRDAVMEITESALTERPERSCAP